MKGIRGTWGGSRGREWCGLVFHNPPPPHKRYYSTDLLQNKNKSMRSKCRRLISCTEPFLTILALFEGALSPLSNKASIVLNGSVQLIIRRHLDLIFLFLFWSKSVVLSGFPKYSLATSNFVSWTIFLCDVASPGDAEVRGAVPAARDVRPTAFRRHPPRC